MRQAHQARSNRLLKVLISIEAHFFDHDLRLKVLWGSSGGALGVPETRKREEEKKRKEKTRREERKEKQRRREERREKKRKRKEKRRREKREERNNLYI